ncbi:MAG: hypothetical protein INR69_19195, partial [Mucilaginibacter polytrichastri]|nr:hypothetical protein [Mucilaginibacter polytrichastri]
NGKAYNRNFIRYSDLMKGGTFDLTMSDLPNKQRGLNDEDKPFSVSKATN